MAYYLKIGYRYLARRKIRSILTILAVLLGVSILMGTLVANDSVKGTLEYHLAKKFGYTDIILINSSGYYSNSINYNEIRKDLDNLKYLGFIWTSQMKESRNIAFQPNISISKSSWIPIVGVDTHNPYDSKFGSISINSSINSNFTTLNDLLLHPLYVNCCVINTKTANQYNVSVGDIVYIYPEVPSGPIDWQNSSSWIQLKITGIIDDHGKAFDYIVPPVNDIWQIKDIDYAIYVNMSIAHQLLTNSDNELKVNNIAIHSNSLQNIDSTLTQIMTYLNNTIPTNSLYGFNLKSFFASEINNIFGLIMSVLIIFSGISLLVCAILIKNMFEVAVEEQLEEIGIMRAIGISKYGIFIIYITQILFISLIGSILGIIIGIFMSTSFFNSIQYVSSILNPSLFELLGSNFEIFITITPQTLILSFISGTLISLIFGLSPAYKASQIQIIDALNPRKR
ncbi:MAG: FtsX-like permease family protein [Candidatus Helarchaeota archaeon]